MRRQEMAECVYGHMGFAASLFLMPVVAGSTAALRAALQGAAIHHDRAGLGGAACHHAQKHAQIMHKDFKATCFYPALSSAAAPYTTVADHWAASATEPPERTR